MTFKYNNVYLNNTSTISGVMEAEGPLSKYFDKSYNDYYMGAKTWELAEIKLMQESIDLVLEKENIIKKDIDLFIAGDLNNQIVASNYTASTLDIPYLGIYSACATSMESFLIASNFIENNQVKKVLVSTSSHNNVAEKQFRYPVEYGGPKRKSTTFTVTGSASAILSSKESLIKVESGTIGKSINSGVKDVYNMGGVMAIAAAKTIYEHLKELKREPNYYDLILTGDLGRYGKDILKEFIKTEYNLELNNLNDSACMIYDINKQSVYAGGSGPTCLPLVAYSYILDQMKKGKLKRVLLVATGALMNTTMVNQKETIPSIAHAISLEVTDDLS